MKRWTIEDLEKTTDLKFAACILNERREGLNPYTPLSQKLEKAKNLILRMDTPRDGEAARRLPRKTSSKRCTGTGITQRPGGSRTCW